MALPGVYQTDADGNIGTLSSGFPDEAVCAMLFDISEQTDVMSGDSDFVKAYKDNVVELNSYDDLDASGLTAEVMNGLPRYHVERFIDIVGNRNFRLFIAFANCSKGWDAVVDMQKAAQGHISQFGVWTGQCLWENNGGTAYEPAVIKSLERSMEKLADVYFSPAVAVLNANLSKVDGKTPATTVDFDKIPSLKTLKSRYVAVAVGQAGTDAVHTMQETFTEKASVGNIGFALGLLASIKVSESIGWVERCNLGNYLTQVEFGFGKAADDYTKYESLSEDDLAALHEKGYIFLRKFMGQAGVFFSSNMTCTDGDFRTIARNRAIGKSRRMVRASLLPYTNAPIKVNPTTGQLHTGTISIFRGKVTDALNAMTDNDEISGIGGIVIDPKQDVLRTDRIDLKYSVVPYGEAVELHVEEGLATSAS